jgi:hypothetical protein
MDPWRKADTHGTRAGRTEPQNAEQGISNVQVENEHSTFNVHPGHTPQDVETHDCPMPKNSPTPRRSFDILL